MRVGKWGILHHWALGKLNSMGSLCTKLSDYMGGWCRRKLNSMGGLVSEEIEFHGCLGKKSAFFSPPPPLRSILVWPVIVIVSWAIVNNFVYF